mgnify:FL=1
MPHDPPTPAIFAAVSSSLALDESRAFASESSSRPGRVARAGAQEGSSPGSYIGMPSRASRACTMRAVTPQIWIAPKW